MYKILKINILTNFIKKEFIINNVDCSSYKELVKVIKKKVLSVINSFSIENLFCVNHLRFTEEQLHKDISNSLIEVFYVHIILPNCAREYNRFEGMSFYFHTNENNHKYFPHIHVSYGGEEISINLKNFKISGSFKNLKKQKNALNYVINNSKNMLKEWEKIIFGS